MKCEHPAVYKKSTQGLTCESCGANMLAQTLSVNWGDYGDITSAGTWIRKSPEEIKARLERLEELYDLY